MLPCNFVQVFMVLSRCGRLKVWGGWTMCIWTLTR